MKTNPNDQINIKKNEGAQSYFNSDGLTKREYFAAMASINLASEFTKHGDAARFSVQYADALIAELNKEEK